LNNTRVCSGVSNAVTAGLFWCNYGFINAGTTTASQHAHDLLERNGPILADHLAPAGIPDVSRYNREKRVQNTTSLERKTVTFGWPSE
jgi:hypothetical protein